MKEEGRRKKEGGWNIYDDLNKAVQKSKVNHLLLPITNYQLPITHYQLPITHYQLPNYQF